MLSEDTGEARGLGFECLMISVPDPGLSQKQTENSTWITWDSAVPSLQPEGQEEAGVSDNWDCAVGEATAQQLYCKTGQPTQDRAKEISHSTSLSSLRWTPG